MDVPARLTAKGMVLHVRLTPRSNAARIAGVDSHGGKAILKAYVTAPPEDGKANAALEALVASWLGVPKSAVTVASGQKSRIKSVTIAGDGPKLLERLSIRATASSGIPEEKSEGDDNG